uniref:WD repeat-containing protein 55 homolog n=1 Tax=Romanomermis culicivorax TaxID=13658 RepID=A0A915JUW0_ROMCU
MKKHPCPYYKRFSQRYSLPQGVQKPVKPGKVRRKNLCLEYLEKSENFDKDCYDVLNVCSIMDEQELILEEDIDQCIELNEQNDDQQQAADSSDEEMDLAENSDTHHHIGASTSYESLVADSVNHDDSILTFKRHTGQIFSVDCGLNPFVCTGGEDDHAFVWNSLTGDVLFECNGHKDSVIAVKYNSKKSLLATADLSGVVIVRNCADFAVAQTFETGCDIEWLLWHHTADILFCGGADSAIWMWLVPSGTCKIYAGHGPPCTAGSLLPDGRRLCTGYQDGVVKIWDLKENASINVTGVACHTNPVVCVACSTDNSIAASGSVDGTLNVFHCSNGKLVDTIACSKQSENMNPGGEEVASDQNEYEGVESISFCPSTSLLAVGTLKGDVILWDLSARQIRQTLTH